MCMCLFFGKSKPATSYADPVTIAAANTADDTVIASYAVVTAAAVGTAAAAATTAID